MSKKYSEDANSLLAADITPEEVFWNRRRLIVEGSKLAGAGALLAAFPSAAWAALTFPARANALYDGKSAERPLTNETLATSYNNFYEFSFEKEGVRPLAEKWKIPTPWKVEVGGLTESKKTYELDDLIKLAGSMEERIYRFRCVEAWSMVVPWTGVPLSALIAKLKPKSSAKYVAFTSYGNAKEMPGIHSASGYTWPYTEGLRMDEAMHPLAFIATGLYGKALPAQNGAPLRLVVPWKYGFKSIKSIVKIEFTTEQPRTLWNQAAPQEYGFYANVNPEVAHPRWSQASERVLNGKLFPTRIATLKFNGYEKDVADLYKGMDLRANF